MMYRFQTLGGLGRRSRRSLIGLDIGARLIKAIQLDSCPSGLRVAAAAVVLRSALGDRQSEPSTAGAGALVGATSDRAADQADRGGRAADRQPRERVDTRPPASPDAAPGVLPTEDLAELANVLYRSGFEGRKLVIAAPPEGLIQAILELPPRSSHAPLEQIARMELARTHGRAADSFELDCRDLPPPAAGGRAGKGARVMAVGYPRAAAGHLLDAFEAVDLSVEAIDVRLYAQARAAAALTAGRSSDVGANGMTALLDLGWSAANLSLVFRDTVVYSRALSDGGMADLRAALARRLSLDDEVTEYLLTEVGLTQRASGDAEAEATQAGQIDLPDDAHSVLATHVDAFVRELLTSFAYAAREYPDTAIARLLIIGGGATVPGLAEHLSVLLGIDAATMTPADLSSCPPGLLSICHSPALTTALGLAMFPRA